MKAGQRAPWVLLILMSLTLAACGGASSSGGAGETTDDHGDHGESACGGADEE